MEVAVVIVTMPSLLRYTIKIYKYVIIFRCPGQMAVVCSRLRTAYTEINAGVGLEYLCIRKI